jgi:Flp pilus assembly protein TadD
VILPTAILAATFLSYVATLVLGFVFDDHILIVTNDSIRSWRYFPGYFTSHIWSFRYPHLLANYYRPLFLTWLRLNDMLFGLHPWGWHLTSVLAHLAVTYLVYRLCLKLTRDGWVAGVAALIFGLHPVHAEAVADITSIQEPLSTLFILGALLTFCRGRESGSEIHWLAGSLALTAAALLSKESGMVLPILVGAYVGIYGEADRSREPAAVSFGEHFLRRLRCALLASIPFWAVVLAYVPLRIWALKGFAHTVTPLAMRTEILTIPSVLAFYLGLLLRPIGLSCYYDLPYVTAATVSGFFLPLAEVLAALAMMIAWYLWTRRARPDDERGLAFASMWMSIAILPVLNFRLLPEGEVAHDRYLYLPSVGFSLLMGLAAVQWLRGQEHITRRPAIVAALAVFVSLLTGFATARQCLTWSDDLTLNYRAHQIAPHNVSATTSLAAAVAQQGMDGAAISLYQQALAIQPGFWQANVNLGYLYYAHGNFPEAARYFSRAIACNPADGDQFLYMGMALLQMGRTSEAERAVRTAMLARPQGKNYHLGLALVLRREGNLQAAMQEAKTELAEDPQNTQARGLLDEVLRQMQFSAREPSAATAPDTPLRNIK